MNSPRLRYQMKPIAQRIFTPEYMDIIAGVPFADVPSRVTEDAIKLLSTLCMSNSKLRSFANTADAAVLASVYDRFETVDNHLASHNIQVNVSKPFTDGALIRFLLIDLYSTLPPF